MADATPEASPAPATPTASHATPAALGDPRAAGVTSGEDPYRDFELYLEKVAVSIS